MNTTPRALATQVRQLSELQKYLRSNAMPLGALLEALGHADAMQALAALGKSSDLYDLIDADFGEELRMLRNALAESGADHPAHRSDFNAAINWHGARLDELISLA